MKKIFLFFLLLIFNGSCTPTYRILTTDYNHEPSPYHKYEMININTGKIDTIFDLKYYLPGVYVKIDDDSTSKFKIIKILE
jgi:hypothetical protein